MSNVGGAKLALLGGPKAVTIDTEKEEIFKWPIITEEDEQAILDVLHRRAMSNLDVTQKFEKEFAEWQGTKYALGFSTGTAAIQCAMYGCGVGVGDEIIAPSLTYWASLLQCFSLGATVVFAEIDAKTLCIDPKDIEHRITERTKAIVVVHYCAHPADMDPIMEIASKYNIKVIEDVSHAQGGLYKGRKLGTIGDVGAMSLMTGKSLAAGEAGMLVTDNVEIYERALAFGHYSRYSADSIQTEYLKPFAGLPLGGYKYRMHQMSSAVGRVQLKYYDERCKQIRKAIDYFWDLLKDIPGLRPHRVEYPDSNMAGWYSPVGFYVKEELGGLSISRFIEAVRAEGGICFGPGVNKPLHTHPLFSECDVYGHGKPTRIANSNRDIRQPIGSLPVTEKVNFTVYRIPRFAYYDANIIEQQANAYRKVVENHKDLLKDDPGDPQEAGSWFLTKRS